MTSEAVSIPARGTAPRVAVPTPGLRLVPMTLAHLDEVVRIEEAAYAFPWSRGNFVDSLVAGYWMQVLREDRLEAGADAASHAGSDAATGAATGVGDVTPGADRRLLAYVVAMPGVDEMHLLNITTAPVARRRGHASRLLETLLEECRRREAESLWLEVRPSNVEALTMYATRGFVEQARRTNYYPAADGRREDAIVMRLTLPVNDEA